MLIPKKVKHRKWQKGRSRKRAITTSKTAFAFGEYGLKSEGAAWVSSRQLEAGRRAMTRFIKRGGKIWIRVFPDKPVTAKGSQSTMGSGKGSVDHYVAVVGLGTMIFEIAGVNEDTAKQAMRLAAHKLPVRTRFVKKDDFSLS